MLHRLLIVLGGIVLFGLFGRVWGTSAAIATALIGAVAGLAGASGIDEPVRGALLRWVLLVAGAATVGAGIGCVANFFAHASEAVVPTAIAGGVIGLVLCRGVQSAS